MQFTAVILMALLTLKLLLLPGKVVVNPMVNKARKLMACGIFLLGIQFLLQYTLHLRAMGVTQAVMLNLFLFIPVSWMISMAVLNLQGKGRIKKTDRWIGGIIWLVTTALIVITAALDGELFSDTPELRTAEITGSVLYATMQCHYAWRQTTNLHSMQRALQNYYDRDMEGMLRWMQLSIIILMVLVIRGCVKGGRLWPVPVTVALLGISAFFQFYRDNKIEFLFEEGWEWALDNAETFSLIAFFLISAGLILTGLKAVAPGKNDQNRKKM